MLISAAVGALAAAGALSAAESLSQDAEGNVWFRTPDGTVLKAGANGDLAVDGRVLINCRQQPGGQVDLAAGEAECYGGYFELEDRFGNELEIYPTFAEAESSDGSGYTLPLTSSPVRVRIGLSDDGAVRVETDVETVTVGAGGEATVEIGGETVVVDGDDFRVRSGGVEVTGDWRGVETRWGAADTEAILVELGAVREADHIRLALGGDVLFDFNSTDVRPDAAGQLAKTAHLIRQRAVGEVYVVGHTDSVGGDDYNLKLSRDRAAAVIGWLIRQEGIPAAALVGRGLGASQPRDANALPDGGDNPEGRARNRRVEILLATREGIDLVNVAGLVRVGAGEVEVGGGAVRVGAGGIEVGGGAVRVDAGGIRVGGVEVAADGVQVPGVTVTGGRVVSDEAPGFCGRGDACKLSCPYGDCRMTCEAGADCDFFCSGGDCVMVCAAGAECDFSCSGGDCSFECAAGSECRTSCSGGDCRRS